MPDRLDERLDYILKCVRDAGDGLGRATTTALGFVTLRHETLLAIPFVVYHRGIPNYRYR